MLSGRYADVLSGLFLGYSTLWYTSHHKDVKGLDKVTDFAMQVTRKASSADLMGLDYTCTLLSLWCGRCWWGMVVVIMASSVYVADDSLLLFAGSNIHG